MKRIIFIGIACACLAAPALADLYGGSLSGSGITGTGAWATNAEITWKVTQNTDGTWHYNYVFSAPAKEFSHFIFEISNDFPISGDFLNLSTQGLEDPKIGWWSAGDGQSNPGMPAPMFGVKFDTMDEWDFTFWTIDFDITRSPMWGNVYAKDGKMPGGTPEVYLYNTDFLKVGEILDRYALESPGAFIAVPNHFVPVPGAVLLGFLGLGYAGMRLRREV